MVRGEGSTRETSAQQATPRDPEPDGPAAGDLAPPGTLAPGDPARDHQRAATAAHQAGTSSTEHAGSFDLERITFFSDAVIAIAMTLLVIDLRLPESLTQTATDEDLRRALDDLARPMFACALSFVVIAMWWYGHHRLFRTLRTVDARMVLLDIGFLASIVFLPFPTTMIGRFANLPTAVVVYAATTVVAGAGSVPAAD